MIAQYHNAFRNDLAFTIKNQGPSLADHSAEIEQFLACKVTLHIVSSLFDFTTLGEDGHRIGMAEATASLVLLNRLEKDCLVLFGQAGEFTSCSNMVDALNGLLDQIRFLHYQPPDP
jgi:hypothetical protein